ncbi:hypothetical protein FACS189494_10460 [Spirochaetia bacterium]|nr:hypothetical protein FACS189494_10460 [Spirochaetia bacterium]
MDKTITPIAKVFLAADGGHGKPFCGPGMVKLLEHIKDTGNVRKACENMQMSYSKGWKLLKALEAWLEYPVTIRRQGGAGGGEAHLTEAGFVFLEKHRTFEAECQKAVQKIYEEYYEH